jgi:hypothetical protein
MGEREREGKGIVFVCERSFEETASFLDLFELKSHKVFLILLRARLCQRGENIEISTAL